MNIQILRELETYSFSELMNIFSNDEEELKNILDSLAAMDMVKRLSKDTPNIELEELLETENLENLTEKQAGNYYVFKYVGIIAVTNTCLIIYPKYIDNYMEDSSSDYKILKQFISVIRKYQSKEQKIALGDNIQSGNFNLLSIVIELYVNYYEHGLYINEEQIIEENGQGEILWEKTINENTAYFFKDRPVYLDTYTVNQENDQNDYLTNLHSFIITEGCNRLKDIFNILDIEPIYLNYGNLDDFGSKDYIIYRINRELSTQFVNYKQNTLKLLKRYIEEDSTKEFSENISFVGTNYYNLIWEDVCSVVFNDSKDKTLKELGLGYSKVNKSSIQISKIISKPKWTHEDSGKSHYGVGTLIPDIVTINEDELSIYDAKYYKIKLDELGVDKQPGINDITKQYLYELAYRDFAWENELCIKRNSFLIPTDENFPKKLGTSSIDFFDHFENEFNDIDIILLPHMKMYEYYLADKYINSIEDLFE